MPELKERIEALVAEVAKQSPETQRKVTADLEAAVEKVHHEIAQDEAVAVNRAGVERQLRFLADEDGIAQVETWLRANLICYAQPKEETK